MILLPTNSRVDVRFRTSLRVPWPPFLLHSRCHGFDFRCRTFNSACRARDAHEIHPPVLLLRFLKHTSSDEPFIVSSHRCCSFYKHLCHLTHTQTHARARAVSAGVAQFIKYVAKCHMIHSLAMAPHAGCNMRALQIQDCSGWMLGLRYNYVTFNERLLVASELPPWSELISAKPVKDKRRSRLATTVKLYVYYSAIWMTVLTLCIIIR